MELQSLDQSRECVIFDIYAKNETFKDAWKEIKASDKKTKQAKIVNSDMNDAKSSFNESFQTFKDAEAKVFAETKELDYTNPKTLDRLFAAVHDGVRKPVRDDVELIEVDSVSAKKANIGKVLCKNAEFVSKYGKEFSGVAKTSEIARHNTPQATTRKYGNIKHGNMLFGCVSRGRD